MYLFQKKPGECKITMTLNMVKIIEINFSLHQQQKNQGSNVLETKKIHLFQKTKHRKKTRLCPWICPSDEGISFKVNKN